MKIGEKLKTLRTSKGYTPEIVSEKIGVSKTTYGRYERNESVPDLNILENIANLYELEMFELLSDEKIILNQNNKKGDNNGLVINQLSEKLIDQYEKKLKTKINKDEKIRNKSNGSFEWRRCWYICKWCLFRSDYLRSRCWCRISCSCSHF
jgi:transcriptional regulator with XRE-family HTH domain